MRRFCYIAAFALCLTTTLALLPRTVHAQQASQDLEYTSEQISDTPVEVFLERMQNPEPNYQKFAAMHALGKKAKDSDAYGRQAILSVVVTAMNDKSRTIYQRWQCCYVISDCGDQRWVPSLADVLLKDPSVTIRSVAAEALGRFKNCPAAKDALRRAAEYEADQAVLDVISRWYYQAEYTQEQIARTSAQTFLARMKQPEIGYGLFAAQNALAKKAKGSGARVRRTILNMVVTAMNDKSRAENQRWQCCYVISGCGDEAWVPYLVEVLVNDVSATMRAVAAEALGKFPKSATAHEALLQAAQHETSQRVLDVINRVLGRTASR